MTKDTDKYKYESFVKDMIEGEGLFNQFGAICSRPFNGIEKEYHIEEIQSILQQLLIISFEFHESQRSEVCSSEVECIRRTAIIYEIVGMLNGWYFPEKEYIYLNPDDEQSPLDYLKVLYYIALITGMPPKYKRQIEVRVGYRLGKYKADLAIVRKRDRKVFYVIECDRSSYYHLDKKEYDRRWQGNIDRFYPGCKVERVFKEQIYKRGSSTVNAMSTSRAFWSKVEAEHVNGLL